MVVGKPKGKTHPQRTKKAEKISSGTPRLVLANTQKRAPRMKREPHHRPQASSSTGASLSWPVANVPTTDPRLRGKTGNVISSLCRLFPTKHGRLTPRKNSKAGIKAVPVHLERSKPAAKRQLTIYLYLACPGSRSNNGNGSLKGYQLTTL